MSPRPWACRGSARVVGWAPFEAEGDDGLADRSSRSHTMPTRTTEEIERKVLAARAEHLEVLHWLGPELGFPVRIVSRILRRQDVPRLCQCDPLTGEVIRSSKTTAVRYEREQPREAGPHGRQEDRPDPRRWRAASPRPRDGLNLATQ